MNMENIIDFFNWRSILQNAELDSINEDFALFDTSILSPVDHPFKQDIAVIIICMKGTMSGFINLKRFSIQPGGLVIFLPGRILEHEKSSDDFFGLSVMMSKPFIDSLNIKEKLHLLFSVNVNPSITLTGDDLRAIKNYYFTLQKIIRVKDNPFQLEMAKHLTISLFYGLTYQFDKLSKEEVKSKQDIFFDIFLREVQLHFKEQRNVGFYADKLCITPKYLGTIIKRYSGKSANSWIDDYVMLEAKALLKSTNMTIQQISEELNFSAQSFFGNYFKQHEGISPKEYRKR